MKRNKDFKKIISRLSKTSGKARGACSQSIIEYLKKTGKGDKIPEIEKKMAEYGYSLKLERINALEMYPVTMELALLFSIQEVLDWGEKEIKELGKNVPKLSILVKILMRYFISPKRSYQECPKYWRKHFDFGELENPEFNEKGKYIILRVKNFNLHPLYCKFLEGYFETITKFVIKTKKFLVKETKCTFKGNSYHEYMIRWE